MTRTVAAEPRIVTRERARYDALRVLWAESVTGHRVRTCRSRGVLPGGSVMVKASGAGLTRSSGLGGVETCGSVWDCPVCSAKIAGHRQAELRAAVAAWQETGGSVALVTLTMRHRAGQALKTLWDGVSYAWHKATSGRGWRDDQQAFGVRGWVRVVEVTHSYDNGWHVHIHALLFLAPPEQDTGPDAVALGASMFARWQAALVRKGFRAPTLRRGVDVKVSAAAPDDLGEYLTKAVYTADHVALEVARGDLKDARHGNRTPFGILRDVVARGDADDLDTWHEWQRASKGRRQMTWSRGLRADLLVTPDLDDQAVVDQDAGGDGLALLPAATYRALRHRVVDLLESARQDDTGAALYRLLADLGLEYSVPDGPTGVAGPGSRAGP